MQIIGIDLGTTNSALATWTQGEERPRVLDIEQLDAPGRTKCYRTLPSFLYIPHTEELEPAESALSWSPQGSTEVISGMWARERGALTPERLVSSAKSWLGHRYVDRNAPILPWGSEITQGKLSPVEASTHYLRHLLAAYSMQCLASKNQDTAEYQAILTVPASFDEVARTLTYDAAAKAGLQNFSLLEEPLAAFYAYLSTHEKSWRDQIKPGDLVLVCDVGGGTTDFSLIAVTEKDGNLQLERISVGEHLLLGGDNMDLALAYALRQDLENEGKKIDHWQFLSLVAQARSAKEKLFSDPSLEEVSISIASRGASLFSSTISLKVERAIVEKTLIEGFFPLSGLDDMPALRKAAGIREFGLTYENDPGITRHLARFLKRSRQNVESQEKLSMLVKPHLEAHNTALLPTAILFNGGVFKATLLRERIKKILTLWNAPNEPVKELLGEDLDLAVALGAAYYGKMRATGEGIRVRSGTARSYYVGIESSLPAVPGAHLPLKGLCLIPQGTEEGSEIELPKEQFGLIVGEPVEFRFFSSAVRAGDSSGVFVENAEEELEESARLSMTLSSETYPKGDIVPVKLDAIITPIGTLQLFMKEAYGHNKWKLEFDVRSQV